MRGDWKVEVCEREREEKEAGVFEETLWLSFVWESYTQEECQNTSGYQDKI